MSIRVLNTEMINRMLRATMTIFVIAIFISPALTGCKKSPPPRPAVKKAPKPEKVDPQPVVTKETQNKDQGYLYDQRGRRDPFTPLIEEVKRVETEDKKKITGTLESYDISDFRVLAIASKGKKRYALLLAPDNRSFTVYKGTVLGFHNGRVEKITDNEVITKEYTEDYLGKAESRQIILELHKGR